jgi:S-adenosylmethionine:tRNA ribosyltransferase-isomerase
MTNDIVLPWDLSIAEFDYVLPKEKIALYPLSKRDESKLLISKSGKIIDSTYSAISGFLEEGSLMVFNKTKVIQARLQFRHTNGAIIEIFCLEPSANNIEISMAMQATSAVEWKCLVGDLRKWKDGLLQLEIQTDESNTVVLIAEFIARESDYCLIKFKWSDDNLSFADVLTLAGKIPLPPYIKRDTDDNDKSRYQTIYADHKGSVAAPTAGLHFTPEIFQSLAERRIEVDYVTLHVGAGTFKPVKAETMGGHPMHSEQIIIEKNFLRKMIYHLNSNVIAVGTTSLRTLESLYWLGLKIYLNQINNEDGLVVEQWDPYRLEAILPVKAAIESVLDFINKKNDDTLIAKTRIIIAPGYKWKIVNTLATNFHQPKSTLILLVASFAGKEWRKIYDHALNNDYRFLSYGDGSLLFR